MMTTHDPLTFQDGLEPVQQLERFCQELREGDAFLAAEIEQSAYLYRFDPDVLSFAVHTPSAKEALHNNIDLLQTRLSAYAPGCKLEIHEESPDGQTPLNAETIFEHHRRLADERRRRSRRTASLDHLEKMHTSMALDECMIERAFGAASVAADDAAFALALRRAKMHALYTSEGYIRLAMRCAEEAMRYDDPDDTH